MTRALRRDWRTVVAVVSGGHFFSHFYMLALPPLFPGLRAEFGLSNTELGLLISAVAIGGLLQMPVGSVVDRLGAKWVFVGGVAVTAGGIALVGLGGSYPVVLAMTAVAGLGQASFHPADYALVDAATDPGLQGRAFSVHTFSGYVGFASAPVVTGTLAIVFDWRVALFAVGAAGLLYAAISAVFLVPVYRDGDEAAGGEPATDAAERSILAALARPGILAMVAFFLLNALASKGIQTFTTVLAVDVFGLTEAVGNTLLTAFFAVGAIGVLVGGVLADRYPPERVIAATLIVGVSVLLVAVGGGVSLGVPLLVVLFGLVGFFTTIVMPSRDRIVSDRSEQGTTGRSFGVVFTGGATGALGGPVLLGAVGDVASLQLSFVLVGAAWLTAGVVAFSLGQGWLERSAEPASVGGD